MEQNNEHKTLNVRDWIILSTTMIGAVLTILALIWQARPSTGIVTVTFLLMLSFVFFVNSVSCNSRANYEAKQGKVIEKKVKNFVTFAEYSFGFGFTLVINAFSILGYEYLLDFIGRQLYVLILPIVFLLTAWIIIIIYNSISYSGKFLKGLRSTKRNLWTLLEIICLVIIAFDFYGMLVIP
ncbi:MAG: hypothetical protein ACFE96_15530 [Candidatus Hermodarchaeota archaeon]